MGECMTDFVAVTSRAPLRLTPPLAEDHKVVTGYRAATGLVEAMDVAMLLGVPLLLTGEPGTGKTRAAYWLANELGGPAPLRFDVKSGSTGRDLLYAFDEVARFRDASGGREARPLVSYLRFSALGEAILRAAGGTAVLTDLGETALTGDHFALRHALLDEAFGTARRHGETVACAHWLLPDEPAFAEAAPAHRVVLIDELDKAPRDTPNDLLAEIDNMAFAIPELGVRVAADPAFRPIVLLTSNSEKSLPEPFLRRCAYFDIPFPDAAELALIVSGAIRGLDGGAPLVRDAIRLFGTLHDHAEIRKKPGTAELLAWIEVLRHRAGIDPGTSLGEALARDPARLDGLLGALVKSPGDLVLAREALRAGFVGRDDL